MRLGNNHILPFSFVDNVQENRINRVLNAFEESVLNPVYDDQLKLDVLRGNSKYYKFINDEWINVYTYDDPKLKFDDYHSISEEGYHILGVDYEWVFIPHFYLCGDLVIQYIGTDSEVLGILDELGDEITGR
ncbi:MAG: hypothetical protein JEZ08_04335 [Clostridiales bacterium]|nr:hypothetical protein [Clostridiales bacterium]